MSSEPTIQAGAVIEGALLPEPVEVITCIADGDRLRIVGKGLESGRVLEPVIPADLLEKLQILPPVRPFDGEGARFKLGVEAARLALAYEYDPFFSLSIARVDPLPHQLEAVYDYFLKLPRIRFLLADDPGAGKTIMAGLLLKELKIRGLVSRVLIVAPANLTFQWQREMKDKFREQFDVMKGDVLRSQYGQNPWQERSQVVTSVSWISRVEDAKESLLRANWDLVIVDEAHKMSAYASGDTKTLAYKIGEELSRRTDHLLMMTATPHKGDPDNFRLFLSLLDDDVYGDIASLHEAMERHEAPFYLRRLKEHLVSFPDPETGITTKLFTNREVKTTGFELDGGEMDFYRNLTNYVEDQSIRAAEAATVQANVMSFQMAMLQRRFASSGYAARRSLERMRDKRQKILDDPEGYRRKQILKKVPDDFDDLDEAEQQAIIDDLEGVVADIDPFVIQDEIRRITDLVVEARHLEDREEETKLTALRVLLDRERIFADPKMKLLIFTEHKDTLDFLAGDGRDGRPLGKLREWGLAVTQIHGGMKIGDRDTPGTRIYAEREFRESAQVLVATEAAGEGINLQFCWMMINYDIPWNPVRLEQRMGRIHRYGQKHDCVIFNFVAKNTREGRVLEKLLERLAAIKDELGTDKVFDVVGEMLPANLIEKTFRDLYARRINDKEVERRIVECVDLERFTRISRSTLEGLAKRDLNLASLIGRTAEAKDRRLVPEVVADFFVDGARVAELQVTPVRGKIGAFRLGRVPVPLLELGNGQEPRFGKLGKEYPRICFDQKLLADDPTLEWVTPGHPLFEAVRKRIENESRRDLMRGAVFWDLHAKAPYRLELYSSAIHDGRGRKLHERLFVVRADAEGTLSLRQPTLFLELVPAAKGTPPPSNPPAHHRADIERYLLDNGVTPFLNEISAERKREVDTVSRHVELSLNALIEKAAQTFDEINARVVRGDETPGLAGNHAQAESHLNNLTQRLDQRRTELEKERQCTAQAPQLLGQTWVLPHPERQAPAFAPMVRDDEVEKTAIRIAMDHERADGWVVESVENENRGYDLLSKKPHPTEPGVFIQTRFIEVKGRSAVGDIALTSNEYRTAQRLGADFWLYVVFNCATEPDLRTIQNPATLGWEPVVKVEQYRLGVALLGGSRC